MRRAETIHPATAAGPGLRAARSKRRLICLVYSAVLFALVHWCSSTFAIGRTMYTTDVCDTLVRSQKQIVGRNIIKVLPSGTALEVRDQDDEWAAVRLEDGRTGFVQTLQLLSREPYKVIAERLQTEAGQQRERLQQIATLREENQRLQDVSKKYEQLRQEASGFVQLQTTYTELQRTHNDVQQQFNRLQEAYATLQKSHTLWWFVSGASVVLAGVALGIILERWRGRTRRRGGYAYNLPG